ncbi:MAG: hypothetical protein WAU68_15090 [Vitreimonas sp.]
MLSFALVGAIGCVRASGRDELTLAMSCVIDREGEPLHVVWVSCVARDACLRTLILDQFREGDLVRIEGEIEQRRRQIGELAYHSLGFVIRSIERLAPPIGGVRP